MWAANIHNALPSLAKIKVLYITENCPISHNGSDPEQFPCFMCFKTQSLPRCWSTSIGSCWFVMWRRLSSSVKVLTNSHSSQSFLHFPVHNLPPSLQSWQGFLTELLTTCVSVLWAEDPVEDPAPTVGDFFFRRGRGGGGGMWRWSGFPSLAVSWRSRLPAWQDSSNLAPCFQCLAIQTKPSEIAVLVLVGGSNKRSPQFLFN